MAQAAGQFEIGVDIGGTFTDVVCLVARRAMSPVKIPTTRRNPSVGVKAVMEDMERDGACRRTWRVCYVHGTTVATNAVIEAGGGRTAC